MIRNHYHYTSLLLSVVAIVVLIGDRCNAFITPHTTKSKLAITRNHDLLLLNQSASASITDIDKETFQRSLLTAQLSNYANKSSKKDESTTNTSNNNDNAQHHLLLSSLNDAVPPAGHHVTTTQTKLGPVHILTVHLGQPGNNEPFVFETGRIGRQAAGAILLTRGESIVYSTCGEFCYNKNVL